MNFGGVADPEQLAILADAVETYCRETGIAKDSREGERLARRVVQLYDAGTLTVSDLKSAMAGERPTSF
jgi:hypothetical protein